MAPAAAVAYSIYISVPHAGAALPLSVGLALAACLLAANSIGQLAKELPSAGGLYTYAARTLGPYVGWMVALALPALRAARRTVPLPRVRLGDARGDGERSRLALLGPVVDLGVADRRDRLPAHLSRHPHLGATRA